MSARVRSSAAEEVEQQYVEHRRAVLAMLRADFPRLSEPEELYQEAWAELLEYRARSGEPVRNVRALLKKIAWRRAADSFRRGRSEPSDPQDGPMLLVADGRPAPDEEVEVSTQAATLRLVIEALDPREAAVLKLRFDHGLSAREIQEQLNLSAKRLEKLMTSAYATVLAQVQPDDAGESVLRRHQRSLLLACEVGIASTRQRQRARRMLEADPACRAMLREMRRNLGGVAAAIPLPVFELLEQPHEGRRVDGFVGWFDQLRETLRHLVERLTGADGVIAGGSSLGAGAVVKVSLACLAAGGTIAVCTIDRPATPKRHEKPAQTASPQRQVASRPDPRPVVRPINVSTAVPHITVAAPAKPTRTRTKVTQSKPTTPVSSPSAQPAASPAPAGATEFGPGQVGSNQSAPAAAASAPADGGGEFAP